MIVEANFMLGDVVELRVASGRFWGWAFSVVTLVFLYLWWPCRWVIFSFEHYDCAGKAKIIRSMLLITGNLVLQSITYMPRPQLVEVIYPMD